MGRYKLDDVFLDLDNILSGTGIEPRGIIHVGAHKGQEVGTYEKNGFKNILLVEPMPNYAKELRKTGHTVAEVAIADKVGEVELYVTDYDQASSTLKPLEHSVNTKITVPTAPLKDVADVTQYNCIVVDVQGAELEVLENSGLEQFDLVIFEGSNEPRYEGAATKQKLADYVSSKGFRHYKTYQHEHYDIYDMVYVKKSGLAMLIRRTFKR